MKHLLSAFIFIGLSSTLYAQTTKLLITNAYLFTIEPNQRDPFKGYIAVGENGLITQLGKGKPGTIHAKYTLDAKGQWIIPGFISAHSHLWQAAFKGFAENQTLQKWVDDVYGRAAHYKPADFYWFAKLGAIDHLQHGITTVYSFNYNNIHLDLPTNAYDKAQFNGIAETKIRFVHGYSPEAITSASQFELGRKRLAEFLQWSNAQGSEAYLGLMINGSTSFNNTFQQPQFEAMLMREYHVRNQTHYLEAADMQRAEIAKFKWLEQSGLLGSDLIFGHFVHPNTAILTATARSHIGITWNPLSNGRLGSGVADIPLYLKLGIPVGMGVDGEASADRADPFENMRSGLYAVRAKYLNAAILSPYQVLWLHTQGSARVLGLQEKVGSLKVGKAGDFLLINPQRLGRVHEDPYANLVFGAGENDIAAVYVGGTVLIYAHQVLHQDVKMLQEKVHALQ